MQKKPQPLKKTKNTLKNKTHRRLRLALVSFKSRFVEVDKIITESYGDYYQRTDSLNNRSVINYRWVLVVVVVGGLDVFRL